MQNFLKNVLIGLILVFSSALSVTTGFFGLNNLGKDNSVVNADTYSVWLPWQAYSEPYFPTLGVNQYDFLPGDTVYIEAVIIMHGASFLSWEGGEDLILNGLNRYSSSTSFIMPAANVTLTVKAAKVIVLEAGSGSLGDSDDNWTWEATANLFHRTYYSGTQIGTLPTNPTKIRI